MSKSYKNNFVKIIYELCDEESIDIESFSDDWIFKLTRKGDIRYIIGHVFGNNLASTHEICCDKSALSDIMNSLGIPHVEHWFFMSPYNTGNTKSEGDWEFLISLLKKYKQLVLKPNKGFSGKDVYHVKYQNELEASVYKIYRNYSSLAVSPYYYIDNEYRVIVLNGEIKLIYLKERPVITGDGIHKVAELISRNDEYYQNLNIYFEMNKAALNMVLNKGEYLKLNWKHNLGDGAKAIIVENETIHNSIKTIIDQIVKNIGIKFASVDIIECKSEYKIIEINSGVTMEHFSGQDKNTYNIAKEIYRDAILNMFYE